MRVGLVLGAGGVLGGAWLTGGRERAAQETEWDPGKRRVHRRYERRIDDWRAGGRGSSALVHGCPLARRVLRGPPRAGRAPGGARLDRAAGAVFRLHRGLPPIGPGSLRMALTALSKPLRHTPGQLMAGWIPSGFISTESLKEVVGRAVPGDWVEHPNYWAVACDYGSAKRVPFGRFGFPPARIADAVAASCAIPGFYRPVRIGGRRYVDGGVCSPSNLDLVAGRGLDLVICLNPMSSSFGPAALEPLDWAAAVQRRSGARRLAHEERKVRRFGTEVLTIEPTREDHAAMGRNWMSAARRRQVIETAERTVLEQLRRTDARELLGRTAARRAAQGPPSRRPALDLAAAGDAGAQGRVSTNGSDPAGSSVAGGVGVITAAAGAAGRLAGAVATAAQRRVPAADLDERDPDYIREDLPGLWMLASLYFRAEVRGLGQIPEEGPVLLVGNHSGGNLTPDTHVFTLAFSTYFGVERRFHQLAHNLVLSMPGLGRLRKYGTVAATPENAERALDVGAALLVYPGGDYEVHRPSWESAKVDFGGRKGFIRLAQRKGVPLVPVVSIGGQETALFLSRGEPSREAAGPRQHAAPEGAADLARPALDELNVGDMLGHIPLPAKITIEVLPAVDVGGARHRRGLRRASSARCRPRCRRCRRRGACRCWDEGREEHRDRRVARRDLGAGGGPLPLPEVHEVDHAPRAARRRRPARALARAIRPGCGWARPTLAASWRSSSSTSRPTWRGRASQASTSACAGACARRATVARQSRCGWPTTLPEGCSA